MRYAVVIEKANGNYSAYVPDLPGCVATAASVKAVEVEIRDAIRFHVEGLKEDGLPVPDPTSIADYVEACPPTKPRSSVQPNSISAVISCVRPTPPTVSTTF